MTLREAKDALKAIAAGRYHKAMVELKEQAPGGDTVIPECLECNVYIEGVGHYSGATFPVAIANLEAAITPIDDRIEELQLQEVVSE